MSSAPEILASIVGLELRARSLVEGLLSGSHRSPMHGFSVEFAEHREYVPGDDLRHVDWKVYGKTDKFYLKQYEQETNLVCYLALDCSASMNYQSNLAPWSKWQCAQTLVSALGYLIQRQQDEIGLALFQDSIRREWEATGITQDWQAIITQLEQIPAQGSSNWSTSVTQLAEHWSRRGIVIVVSDGLADPEEILLGLRRLRSRRHDVIFLQVLDPAEVSWPFQQVTRFTGLEGEPAITVDARQLASAYAEEFSSHQRTLLAGCRELGCDQHVIYTHEPLGTALAGFLSHRQQKRVH
jgi:uncharacterized protein (DUF58 family)